MTAMRPLAGGGAIAAAVAGHPAPMTLREAPCSA
jgi:hypothetical protein